MCSKSGLCHILYTCSLDCSSFFFFQLNPRMLDFAAVSPSRKANSACCIGCRRGVGVSETGTGALPVNSETSGGRAGWSETAACQTLGDCWPTDRRHETAQCWGQVGNSKIIRLHRMREMQTVVTDVHSVCPKVCHATLSYGWAVCVAFVQPLPNYFGLLLLQQTDTVFCFLKKWQNRALLMIM